MNNYMKIALSSRQPPDYLSKANEIRVKYRDYEIIYDFIEKYPDKTYILEIPYSIENPDWTEIKSLNRITTNLLVRVSRISDALYCEENNIPYFYGMIITTWEDLTYLSKSKSKYAVIGGDLFFSLETLKKYFSIPVRVVPNFIEYNFLNRLDTVDNLSVVSPWLQPEGTKFYEGLIDVLEFENCTLEQERAYYRLYGEGHEWRADLATLIVGLNADAKGRLINPEYFYPPRLNCGRRCLSGYTCRSCFRQLNLANKERLKEYKETVLDAAKKEQETTEEETEIDN